MAKQVINIGAAPNDGTGTPLRTSFDYTNQNFTELYTALGGGVGLPGATTQVIFNDGGTNLAGDAGLVYNKTTDALTVAGLVTAGSTTITGDLTVDTSTLKVDSTNNRVGVVQATPLYPLHLVGEFGLEEASSGNGTKLQLIGDATKYNFRLGKQLTATNTFEITPSTALGGTTFSNPVYTVTYDGIHKFLDGAGGTRITLNSTGLLVGTTNDLTGANISSSKGLGTANIATNRFATVEYGSGASGVFTTITISFTVNNTGSSVIIEALLTGFSGVYLDHVAGMYSNQTAVVIRNNASVGTTVAALAVDGTSLIYTLTITTAVTHPVIKVKATVGGLGQTTTLPVITFA